MEVLTLATDVLAHGEWGPGPWWPIFPIFWVLVLSVLTFGFFRFRGHRSWHRGQSAETVLAERYARGEISAEEYRERLQVLNEQQS